MEENKGYGFVIVSSEDMADKMAIQHATFEFKGRRVELKKSVSNTQGQYIVMNISSKTFWNTISNQYISILYF